MSYMQSVTYLHDFNSYCLESTSRQHSDNIQTTFRQHSDNIQATFRQHSDNIQSPVRLQTVANPHE